MEYIDGRTLSDYLAEKPSTSDRKRIFDELLSAIDYLHKRGVIHNDIKPENILITKADNTLKLIDFGFADNDAHYALCTLGCTPQYASPELREHRDKIDARSDIYSIGMLMGEILGNKYRHITQRCTHTNPKLRYSNIQALQQAWHHRNRLPKVLISIIAAIVFILPLTLLIEAKYSEQQKINEREIFFAQIERDIEDMYTITMDSVIHATYMEFANNNIITFYNAYTTYHAEKIASIDDIELNTMANNVYMQKLNNCNTRLIEAAQKLPSIHQSNLDINELLFYNNLLIEQKPFKPYKKE